MILILLQYQVAMFLLSCYIIHLRKALDVYTTLDKSKRTPIYIYIQYMYMDTQGWGGEGGFEDSPQSPLLPVYCIA